MVPNRMQPLTCRTQSPERETRETHRTHTSFRLGKLRKGRGVPKCFGNGIKCPSVRKVLGLGDHEVQILAPAPTSCVISSMWLNPLSLGFPICKTGDKCWYRGPAVPISQIRKQRGLNKRFAEYLPQRRTLGSGL